MKGSVSVSQILTRPSFFQRRDDGARRCESLGERRELSAHLVALEGRTVEADASQTVVDADDQCADMGGQDDGSIYEYLGRLQPRHFIVNRY